MTGDASEQHHDVLDVAARHARLATWGTPPEGAVSLARRLIDRFERVTDARLSRGAAQHRVPAIDSTRIEPGDHDALARLAPVRIDDDARRAFSLGKSYPDLLAARGERLEAACDLVVQPRSEHELDQAIEWCADGDVAMVPVGGGTSVVGGIEPLAQRADQVVAAIDVSRLTRCVDVDIINLTATFQAGIRGPQLEAELAPLGLTLGHVPQSFEYATLGGWIATRGAGQQSLRYGKIERMTAALRVSSPAGIIETSDVPAHGAGPDLRELLLGSEGTCGVITRATMRVSARPTHARFASYLFASFADAADAARTLVQHIDDTGVVRPMMVRVSDGDETAFNVGSSVPAALGGRLGRSLARVLGYGEGALVFVVFAGSLDEVRRSDRYVTRWFSARGGRSLGAMPTRHWYHGRFRQPYARDLMIDAGMMVDTLETSVTWSRLPELHLRVRAALQHELARDGHRCVVGCHLSHLYRDGASAYFTFMSDGGHDRAGQLQRWRRVKAAVHEVLATTGAAISHQHGVGTMHSGLYGERTSPVAIDAMRAARQQFDPTGLLNPGKLYEPPPSFTPVVNRVAGAR